MNNQQPKDVSVILGDSAVAGIWMTTSKSGKAILIDFYGIEEWIPTSQCEIIEDTPVRVRVEDWLAERIKLKLGEAY